MRGRRRTAGLAAITGAVGAAACVAAETGPNVIVSARLEGVPPSIVLGDVLRDSTGARLPLTAVAFDESGRPLPTTRLRFTYVPTLRDSLNRLVNDTALRVDSLGIVTSTTPRVLSQAVVGVRVSDRLQLLDTLQIVLRPDSAAVADTVVSRFTFSCADPSLSFAPANSAGADDSVRNGSRGFGVTVLSDSGGTRGSAVVRSRLVRWTIVSPATVRMVRLPGGTAADTVPALSVVDSASTVGARLRFDTTDAAGRSAVRLRVRAAGLGPSVFPDTFSVVVRGEVQPGNARVRRGTFTVRVPVRRMAAPAGTTSYCQ